MISRHGIEALRHRGRVRRIGAREGVAPRLSLLCSLGAGVAAPAQKILGNLKQPFLLAGEGWM